MVVDSGKSEMNQNKQTKEQPAYTKSINGIDKDKQDVEKRIKEVKEIAKGVFMTTENGYVTQIEIGSKATEYVSTSTALAQVATTLNQIFGKEKLTVEELVKVVPRTERKRKVRKEQPVYTRMLDHRVRYIAKVKGKTDNGMRRKWYV